MLESHTPAASIRNEIAQTASTLAEPWLAAQLRRESREKTGSLHIYIEVFVESHTNKSVTIGGRSEGAVTVGPTVAFEDKVFV